MFNRALGALWWLESAFVRLAEKKGLAIALAGLLPIVIRTLLLPILPVPRPAIQDEFSYLLAADTFASGRLTNSTPALAEHFETPQVMVRPTYASKYPPLSGLVMAAAQKVTGQPWIAVLLSMGVLCALICWALEGWLPPVWALTGGLIAALHIGIVSYWTEGYWGGALPAIGGALLIGAVPRLISAPSPGAALAYASGLGVLANTRPFEGLVFAMVCSGYLILEWIRARLDVGLILWRAVVPMTLLLIPVAAWMGYYNFRVTGNALHLPYVVHDQQYALLPPLVFETREQVTPVYSNAFLRDFWQADRNAKVESRQQIVTARVWDLAIFLQFLVGLPLAGCMLLVARPLWQDAIARKALALAGLGYLGPALDTRTFPHYAAAEAVLVFLIAACALRAIRNAWPGVEGAYWMWGALLAFAIPTGLGLLTPANRCLVGSTAYLSAYHATVDEQLQREAGRRLVLVRYGPGAMAAVREHHNYQELVYNHADIDGSKVIWARSLGAEKDAELIRHYPDREVWVVEENGGITLARYSFGAGDSDARLVAPVSAPSVVHSLAAIPLH